MKIKEDFIMREVGGQNIVVAVGKASKDFNGLIRLNETGKLLWKTLAADSGASRAELVKALTAEYDIDDATAGKDVDAFVAKLSAEGIITN